MCSQTSFRNLDSTTTFNCNTQTSRTGLASVRTDIVGQRTSRTGNLHDLKPASPSGLARDHASETPVQLCFSGTMHTPGTQEFSYEHGSAKHERRDVRPVILEL